MTLEPPLPTTFGRVVAARDTVGLFNLWVFSPRDAAGHGCGLVSPAAIDMAIPRYDPCLRGDGSRTVHHKVTPAGFPLSLHLTRLVTWCAYVLLAGHAGIDRDGASVREEVHKVAHDAGLWKRIILCSSGDPWLAILEARCGIGGHSR